jgi:predicted ATPase/DNA-binding XRE family transcriptional regulator
MEEHSFGYWLRLRRKTLDLTQDGLADRVGCSVAMIRKIESEERRPSAQIIERLAGILNISEEERTAFLRFARGDWRSAPFAIKDDLSWKAPAKPSHTNLPATTTSLIGRQKEIALLHGYLRNNEIRLVTLIGPPGIGKTRLSIEAARESRTDFLDGVFFVALAPFEDAALIAMTIAQTLGFIEVRNVSPEELLKEGIGEKEMLLVLDNCEHLIGGVASIASDLLSACSRLKILVTSRESLRVSGEWLYTVPAFDLPAEHFSIDVGNVSQYPALMLFAERARAVRADFSLTSENIETVTAICARLDGLPLVIELMAARMRLMSPQALLDRLTSQFVLTADGMRAASERQKTLRNAIDWSYNLLSEQEQKLFVYLSVFSDGFILTDAETIFAHHFTEKSVPELLTLLLDKSLIRWATNESSEDRYQMLVTIHEYALNQLKQSGEESEIRNRHLAYFLDLAEKADKELYGHHQLEWLSRLRATRDNLRAALDWAIGTEQTESALQMALKLDWFRHICSDHVEAAQSLLRVLDLPDVSSFPGAHAEVLVQLQHHKHLLGDHFASQIEKSGVVPYAEQALAIARAHNDIHNSARALSMIGLNLIVEKNFAEAQSVLEESGNLFQQARDDWGYAYIVMLLGWMSFVQNDLPSALPVLEQAFTIFEKLGERYFMCVCLRYVGIIQIKLGNIKQGVGALRDSLTLAQQLDSKYEIAAAFFRWGQAAQYLGSPARTVTLFWAAKNAHETIAVGVWTQGLDTEFETVLERCRAELGEAMFEAAVEKGRAMTIEQATAARDIPSIVTREPSRWMISAPTTAPTTPPILTIVRPRLAAGCVKPAPLSMAGTSWMAT